MKTKYLYYFILPALLISQACSKKMEVEIPTLDIKVTNGQLVDNAYTFKLGDTVKFAFSGYAENISVYTGDASHNYEYRNRTRASGIPQLSFTSLMQLGTQANTLQVLATNSLAKVDSTNITNANWVDITSRATLSTGTAIASGIIDLSDLVKNADDALFVAFKYSGKTGSTQRTWTITNLVVNSVFAEGPQAISTLANDNPYWTKFKMEASTASWNNTTSQLQLVGGAATAPDNVSWIVSKPLYVNRVSPDWAVGLKNIGNANLTSYNYKYTAPGKYKIVFVVSNTSVDENSQLIKEVTVNVIP